MSVTVARETSASFQGSNNRLTVEVWVSVGCTANPNPTNAIQNTLKRGADLGGMRLSNT